MRDGACGKNNGHAFDKQSSFTGGAQVPTGAAGFEGIDEQIICFTCYRFAPGPICISNVRQIVVREFPGENMSKKRAAAGFLCVIDERGGGRATTAGELAAA